MQKSEKRPAGISSSPSRAIFDAVCNSTALKMQYTLRKHVVDPYTTCATEPPERVASYRSYDVNQSLDMIQMRDFRSIRATVPHRALAYSLTYHRRGLETLEHRAIWSHAEVQKRYFGDWRSCGMSWLFPCDVLVMEHGVHGDFSLVLRQPAEPVLLELTRNWRGCCGRALRPGARRNIVCACVRWRVPACKHGHRYLLFTIYATVLE